MNDIEKKLTCTEHEMHVRDISDLRNKLGLICTRIEKCENAVEEISLIKQSLQFNYDTVKEIKDNHKTEMDKLAEEIKKDFNTLSNRMEWSQRIVYLMFGALVLSVAGRFILSAIDKG